MKSVEPADVALVYIRACLALILGRTMRASRTVPISQLIEITMLHLTGAGLHAADNTHIKQRRPFSSCGVDLHKRGR